MKDTVDQIYDELNAQVVRMLEHSLNQASRIADLERQLRNAKFAENLDAEDKAFFASLRAPSAPAVEQPIGHISKGMLEQLRERLGVSGYVQSGRTEEFPVALYAAPQAADTDKVREAILALRIVPPRHYDNAQISAFCLGAKTMCEEAAKLTASMAAQAPVREVPGYKLVPLEVTDAMLEAWKTELCVPIGSSPEAKARRAYRAMLAAAPVQQEG